MYHSGTVANTVLCLKRQLSKPAHNFDAGGVDLYSEIHTGQGIGDVSMKFEAKPFVLSPRRSRSAKLSALLVAAFLSLGFLSACSDVDRDGATRADRSLWDFNYKQKSE